MKGRAAQTFASFGERNEGSSSGSPRVAFVAGSGVLGRSRARRWQRKPPDMLPSLAAVQRELRRERDVAGGGPGPGPAS